MRFHIAPAPSPQHRRHNDSHPPQSPSPTVLFQSTTEPSTSAASSSSSNSKFPVEFSPPLIAMVIIIATAFVVITYSRLISRHLLQLHRRYLNWSRRRRRLRNYVPSASTSNIGSPPNPFDHSNGFHIFSPGGLVESAIKTIPLSIYTRKSSVHNCAICLLEFKENDYVRTLPVCSHAFHVDCIDIWLRSHANCPLCRAGIFRPESPFIPVMATRIRPDLDDIIIQSTILEPLSEIPPKSDSTTIGEITEEPSPRGNVDQLSEDRYNGRDFLLKRSYSFGFERNLGSERMVVEPVTASPWRYRRGVGSFWSKRPSPFNSLTKPRVFSFRSYRGINMKSPFFRRRGDSGSVSFFPLSESSARFSGSASAGGIGGGSSRRRNMSFASPMFMRSSAAASASGSSGFFSSSRLRSGDPEALLSPDRFNKR